MRKVEPHRLEQWLDGKKVLYCSCRAEGKTLSLYAGLDGLLFVQHGDTVVHVGFGEDEAAEEYNRIADDGGRK